MLFTTATFALLYLPVTLLGFFLAGRWSQQAAAGWLFLASLFFYGWWMPVFTLLLVASIAVNFALGLSILRVRDKQPSKARAAMVVGVVFNLGLLGYFKYANFLVDNLNAVLGTHWSIGNVILPIGISFYSFTQIAFLADTARGKVKEADVVHYGLFVTYFPHLIAGPVLHHAQMMPQFADPSIYRPREAHLAAGTAIFALGLLKKVVCADGISPYADAVFVAADAGQLPSVREAWLGALAYTLQLYFDFSGYSDMAVGLSWLFNVRLPINFNSPYKATSISDFWRRWHVSLSTFLRDYLYIALGGNRHGAVRRYANLLTTMVIGGLWHGASWTFVAWGTLHGLYLLANHAFCALVGQRLAAHLERSRLFAVAGWAMTMLAVVVGWVFFRSVSFEGAARMLEAMAGRGAPGSVDVLLWNSGLSPATGAFWCAVLGTVAVFAPNTNEIGERLLTRARTQAGMWRPALATSAALAALLLVVINTTRDASSAFIYFNF